MLPIFKHLCSTPQQQKNNKLASKIIYELFKRLETYNIYNPNNFIVLLFTTVYNVDIHGE